MADSNADSSDDPSGLDPAIVQLTDCHLGAGRLRQSDAGQLSDKQSILNMFYNWIVTMPSSARTSVA